MVFALGMGPKTVPETDIYTYAEGPEESYNPYLLGMQYHIITQYATRELHVLIDDGEITFDVRNYGSGETVQTYKITTA